MHFLASKIIGFFVVPSNFILILAVCGPLGATPLSTALLLSLENRAPTGIIVLGGIINPEISAQRGDIALGAAFKALSGRLSASSKRSTQRAGWKT